MMVLRRSDLEEPLSRYTGHPLILLLLDDVLHPRIEIGLIACGLLVLQDLCRRPSVHVRWQSRIRTPPREILYFSIHIAKTRGCLVATIHLEMRIHPLRRVPEQREQPNRWHEVKNPAWDRLRVHVLWRSLHNDTASINFG